MLVKIEDYLGFRRAIPSLQVSVRDTSSGRSGLYGASADSKKNELLVVTGG
jgi:hypothetical protein